MWGKQTTERSESARAGGEWQIVGLAHTLLREQWPMREGDGEQEQEEEEEEEQEQEEEEEEEIPFVPQQ